LPELIEPLPLLYKPATGEQGEKYAMPYQSLFITKYCKQVCKPFGHIFHRIQRIERPFDGFYALTLK
jgi:hypothetical protein